MLHDMTPETEDYLNSNKAIGYIGFDPTAPSLTIGNYVQIMLLQLFQKAGHKPIVLMGGATGRIGDPSMRDSERELKSYEELQTNLNHQKEQFKRLLNFEEGDNKAEFRNNLDFYNSMNVLDFLRDVGKNLTINYMMAKESVKKRIETGISFTEFSYQLIQGYDFQLLYQQDNCKVQMGGSDQWGNITSGTEMIRRNIGQKAYALTTPLLTKADGTKFGKSLDGNIWLDAKLTSPYKFYQFWINSDDRDIPKFIKYFSLKSRPEMVEIIELSQTQPRAAKKMLAEELTIRIHSKEDFENVMKVSEIIFNPKMDAQELSSLSESVWEAVSSEVPGFKIQSPILEQPVNIVDLLCDYTEIFTSKGEARRAIKNNALKVNKSRIDSPEQMIASSDLFHQKYLLVENGKKNKFTLMF